MNLRTVLYGLTCTALLCFGQVTWAAAPPPIDAYDLAVSISANKATAVVGDTITYTVTLSNQQATAVSGVSVKVTFPTGTSPVGSGTASLGSYDANAGFWTLTNIASTDLTETLVFKLLVTTEGSKYCKAEVVAMVQTDIDSSPNSGPVTEDDIAYACTSVPLNFCNATSINITATAFAGLTNYKWYKDGGTTPVGTSQTLTITDVGTYTYTAEIGGAACPGELCCPIVVQKYPALSLTSSSTPVSCFGGSDGSVTVVANGGMPGYTYLWSGGGTASTKTSVPIGVYTVTVTDSKSCSATTTATVTQPAAAVTVTTASTPVSCFNGANGTATASPLGGNAGGYTYTWSNGGNTQTITGLTAGTYTVTVRDTKNCSSTSSVTVTQPTQLMATASGVNPTCNGAGDGSVAVSASGGTTAYSYAWSTPGSTSNTMGSLGPGTYTVTVTDANLCTTSTQVTITQPSTLVATATMTVITCYGQNNGTATVSATGGNGGNIYTWSTSPVQNTTTATGLYAGVYTVTVKDALNCQTTTSVEVTQPNELTATIVQDSVDCFGGNTGTATVTPVGGNGGNTYTWSTSPAQNTPTATGLIAGSYTVTVKDSKNCLTFKSVVVLQPTALTATIAQDSVDCFGGSSGTATVTPSGGTLSYLYSWNNTQTTATATGLSIGTYTVTVTDNHSCTVTKSVTVLQPTALAATIVQDSVNCFGGSSGTATVTPSGGTLSYSYNWTNSQTTATATGLSIGAYTVTVADHHGCSITRSVTVLEPPVLAATIVQDSVNCFGGNTGTATVTPSGGTLSYSYNWSNTQTTSTATGLSIGAYTVTVTDHHGCTISSSVTVLQPPVLAATIVQDSVNCFGGNTGTATVTPSGGTLSYSYNWSNTQTTSTATGLSIGAYTVTVTDHHGCTISSSVTVLQPPALTAAITQDSVNCFGGNTGTATVTPSGGTLDYAYNWSNTQTTATATGLIAATYSVTVTDHHGCTTSRTIAVLQPPVLAITTTTTPETCGLHTDGTATVNITGGTASFSISWSTGATIATTTGLADGSYTVTVTDHHLCSTTSVAVVSVTNCDWGDLPDATAATATGDYQTTNANNGPYHSITASLRLGSTEDGETNGQPNVTATGDGADEDGVGLGNMTSLVPGHTIKFPFVVTNTTGSTAYLDAWIDWNGDGDFDDAGETVADVSDATGSFPTSITFTIPATAVQNTSLGFRVRLSNTSNLTPYGYTNSGEVEDYLITVACPTPVCLPATTSN